MKKVSLHDGFFLAQFSVSPKEFKFVLGYVKAIKGSRFHPYHKGWLIPASSENMAKLVHLGFSFMDEIKAVYEIKQQFVIPETPRKDVNHALLPKEIRDYQIRGVEFLEAVDGKGIVGDAPRLGKTLQALGYTMLHPGFKRVLIVCPSNVKIGWESEIQKWLHESSIILYGQTPFSLSGIKERFFVVNYDILFDWKEELKLLGFDLIVVDELHYLGNRKRYDPKTKMRVPVQRTLAFEELMKKIPHRILLSGTAIKAAPVQFFTALHAVAPKVFPSEMAYKKKFCDPKQTLYGMDYTGLSNAEELISLIAPYMIRRRKEDVLSELPEKQRIVVDFDKDGSEGREQELADKLRWIEDFLVSGEKLVVFAWHRDICKAVHDRFKDRSVLVYGGIDSREREKRREKFQTDNKTQLFVGQVVSANVGIELSAADTVAFVELPYNPGDLEQAEERVFMPGDGKQRITVYYLVGKDSPEENIAMILENKNKIVSKVLDNKNATVIFS